MAAVNFHETGSDDLSRFVLSSNPYYGLPAAAGLNDNPDYFINDLLIPRVFSVKIIRKTPVFKVCPKIEVFADPILSIPSIILSFPEGRFLPLDAVTGQICGQI